MMIRGLKTGLAALAIAALATGCGDGDRQASRPTPSPGPPQAEAPRFALPETAGLRSAPTADADWRTHSAAWGSTIQAPVDWQVVQVDNVLAVKSPDGRHSINTLIFRKSPHVSLERFQQIALENAPGDWMQASWHTATVGELAAVRMRLWPTRLDAVTAFLPNPAYLNGEVDDPITNLMAIGAVTDSQAAAPPPEAPSHWQIGVIEHGVFYHAIMIRSKTDATAAERAILDRIVQSFRPIAFMPASEDSATTDSDAAAQPAPSGDSPEVEAG